MGQKVTKVPLPFAPTSTVPVLCTVPVSRVIRSMFVHPDVKLDRSDNAHFLINKSKAQQKHYTLTRFLLHLKSNGIVDIISKHQNWYLPLTRSLCKQAALTTTLKGYFKKIIKNKTKKKRIIKQQTANIKRSNDQSNSLTPSHWYNKSQTVFNKGQDWFCLAFLSFYKLHSMHNLTHLNTRTVTVCIVLCTGKNIRTFPILM